MAFGEIGLTMNNDRIRSATYSVREGSSRFDLERISAWVEICWGFASLLDLNFSGSSSLEEPRLRTLIGLVVLLVGIMRFFATFSKSLKFRLIATILSTFSFCFFFFSAVSIVGLWSYPATLYGGLWLLQVLGVRRLYILLWIQP